jgi:hypothetical protein
MKITNARFVNMDAKRSVESWANGEPEVRVTVMYTQKNHSTNTYDPKYSSYLYPNSWIKVKGFSSVLKWVDVPVTFPYWYYNEQSFDRRIIWTEEDGATKKTTITGGNNYADSTGIITSNSSYSIEIPASDNDITFADNTIDYLYPGPGEQNWGIIKFILQF